MNHIIGKVDSARPYEVDSSTSTSMNSRILNFDLSFCIDSPDCGFCKLCIFITREDFDVVKDNLSASIRIIITEDELAAFSIVTGNPNITSEK